MDLLNEITVTEIAATLAPYGLNLIGTATRAAYESLVPAQYHVTSLLPQTQSIVVIGNGGGAFWAGFRDDTDDLQEYSHPQGRAHPLDDYTVEVIEKSLTPLLQASGATYQYVYPFRFGTQPVSFMHLAQASGLAGPSILGIVIHPTYGPWMALRAAVLIDQQLSSPPSAQGFDPCPSCTERSCVKACPANVVSVEKGWDIPGCIQHRVNVPDDCVAYCHARYECVYGRQHRYPLDELQYHQAQSLATMREYVEDSD